MNQEILLPHPFSNHQEALASRYGRKLKTHYFHIFNKFDDILIPINSRRHTVVRCVDGKTVLLKNIKNLLA